MMKDVVKLLLISSLLIFSFFVACEKTEEEETHPLVGTWEMTNMEQTSTYIADANLTTIGKAKGDTLASGTMTWTQFSAMGVSATVILKDDETFTLTGNLPLASDTLGVAPTIVPLNDQGTWVAADDLSTLLIDGQLYDIGGVLTLDDEDNPTVISMTYSEASPDTVVLPIDANQDGIPDMFLPDVPIVEHSTTTLGFTK
jgi:hypothetical protein